ncbi:MAG: hypothetical protein Q9226_009251, partial [Calogaya cf. arnoldii]
MLPEKEIILLYLRQKDFKYLTALAAFYVRLTFETTEVFKVLEPLLGDWRKLRRRTREGGWRLDYMDQFVDDLLVKDRVCATSLRKLPNRMILEDLGHLEVRVSPLGEEIDEIDRDDDEIEEVNGTANGFGRVINENSVTMHFSRLFTIVITIVPTIAGAPLEARRRPQRQQTHVLTLNRKLSIPSQHSRYTQNRESQGPVNSTVSTATLKGIGEITYTTNITFGTQSFEAIVDTGSSDTWAIQGGLQCVRGRRSSETVVPESQCGFGPPITLSPTFKQIPGQVFKIGYNDQTQVTGIVGTETVTLAGITVKNQEVGLVNHADWSGNNASSGLIGLAFPNLTSAYQGDDPKYTAESDAVP